MSKPPAFQFYAKDWLADVRVRALSRAARGDYIDLLALGWENGGIPAEARARARVLGLTPKQEAVAWAELEQFFVAHPSDQSLLVNRRQERERDALDRYRDAQAEKGRRSGESRRNNCSGPVRTADEQRLNHGSRPVRTGHEPEGNSASASASASAENPPQPPLPGGHGQSAPDPDPEPAQNQAPEPPAAPDVAVDGIVEALTRGGLRPRQGSFWVRREANRLHGEGMTAEDANALADLARARASENPGGLLATWITKLSWREVLDEQRSKRRQAEAVQRGRDAAPKDILDELKPLYGEEPKQIGAVAQEAK